MVIKRGVRLSVTDMGVSIDREPVLLKQQGEIMTIYINLTELQLDAETHARISHKVNVAILGEIAHLDLSKVTTIGGKLGPETVGFIATNDITKALAEIPN